MANILEEIKGRQGGHKLVEMGDGIWRILLRIQTRYLCFYFSKSQK
jgi:hypothetical protein